MDRYTDRLDITEIMLKTVLNTIEINQLITFSNRAISGRCIFLAMFHEFWGKWKSYEIKPAPPF